MPKKKHDKMPKALSQRYHAQKNYHIRYGSRLSKENYIMLCSLIKDRKPCVSLVDKQTNRVSVYSIKCDLHEQNIIAIFDKRRGKICTFLPIGTTKETIEWEKFDDIESELWEGEKHEEEHLL